MDLTETVARALWEADCGAVSYEWDDVSEGGRSKWRRLAADAIAALPPSPAEEAVKRVEALAEELEREWAITARGCRLPADDFAKAWRSDAANRIRAALASPAPAPQGEEGQR